jgi:hypothetical protein
MDTFKIMLIASRTVNIVALQAVFSTSMVMSGIEVSVTL